MKIGHTQPQQRQNEPEQRSPYLTVSEVAKLVKVTSKTVRQWIRAGRLPAIRVGRTIRVRREALEAVLRAGEQGGASL